jgi:hypothetical protein
MTAAPEASADASAFAAHIDESKAAKELGADYMKLLQIAKLSPKTHKSLIKSYLYSAVSECSGQQLVDVQPAEGLAVAGKNVKVQAKAYDGLRAAGALAKQRGMSIEVVSGHASIRDAVAEWNHAIIQASLDLAKKASAADQKEKSFAADARKLVDSGDGPKSWTASVCESGKLAGWAIDVQLVTVDANGKRGSVLVKAGPDGDRFTQDAFESTYWDKPKGKSYRMLTEIMSAGKFVRTCDRAYRFTTSPTQDETWRCKQGTESWDPSNRPLPAWQ